MSSKVRRVAGALLILAACGAGATGFVIGGVAADPTKSPQARLAAEAARRNVESAWKAQRLALEAKATAIAAISAAARRAEQPGRRTHAGRSLRDRGVVAAGARRVQDRAPDRRRPDAGLAGQARPRHRRPRSGARPRARIRSRRASRVVGGVPLVLVAVHVPVLDDGGAGAGAREPARHRHRARARRPHQPGGHAVRGRAARSAIAGTADQRLMIQGLVGREIELVRHRPARQWVAAVVTLGAGVRVWTLQSVVIEGLATQTPVAACPWARRRCCWPSGWCWCSAGAARRRGADRRGPQGHDAALRHAGAAAAQGREQGAERVVAAAARRT